jgi:hypothetical protein
MAAYGEPTIKNHIDAAAYREILTGNSSLLGTPCESIPASRLLTVYISLKEVNPAAG